MDLQLPEGWIPVDESESVELEAELRREGPASHRLHGQDVRAVARRKNRKDILFRSESDRRPVFWVHLTWTIESDAQWPSTEMYSTIEDFLVRWPAEELDAG